MIDSLAFANGARQFDERVPCIRAQTFSPSYFFHYLQNTDYPLSHTHTNLIRGKKKLWSNMHPRTGYRVRCIIGMHVLYYK